MPDPSWNDPDWPTTCGGWLLTAAAFLLLIGSVIAVAYLVAAIL